ncbi:Hypothetical predicted protein [Cloeon dipterum]|uniref:AXH domain-containing protein n=1 Tax=Cloeon dipterum TaxID=197152 RepID=A0A8S1DQ97_9INSE|nr:Hypothetical predicted protein [Cloeon dipterum]
MLLRRPQYLAPETRVTHCSPDTLFALSQSMLTTSSSHQPPKQTAGDGRAMTYDPYLNNPAASGEGKVPEFLRPLPKHATRYANEQKQAYMAHYGGEQMMNVYTSLSGPQANVNLMHKSRPLQYLPQPVYMDSIMPYHPPLAPHPLSNMSLHAPHPQQHQMRHMSRHMPPRMNVSFYHQPQRSLPDARPTAPLKAIHLVQIPQILPQPPPQKTRPQPLPPPQPPQQPPTQQQQPQPPPPPPPAAAAAFKVPSGKEGSLKYRILTRPEADEALAASVPDDLSPAADPVLSASFGRTVAEVGMTAADFGLQTSTTDTTPWNARKPEFARGTLIVMPHKKVKVEDLRTEDFVTAAQVNPKVSLNPSTVVRIVQHGAHAVLFLRLGSDQKTTEIAVVLEHPLFVYGKGWASVRPDLSESLYDLPVEQLRVTDTCIFMTLRSEESKSGVKRRWSAPAVNGITDMDQDCPQPPPARRMKH